MAGLTSPDSKKLATHFALAKYGITPSCVHYTAVNLFCVPAHMRDCFQHYHLLYWRADYLLQQVSEGALRLSSGDYIVIYHRCTRGQLIENPQSQVALSFRKAQPEFGLAGYVLVSIPTAN